MNENSEMQRFIKPGIGGMIGGAIFFGVMLLIVIGGLSSSSAKDSGGAIAIMLGVGLLIGGVIAVPAYKARKRYNEAMETLRRQDKLEAVEREFAAAKSVADGELRLGENYMFGRKGGAPVAYGEVTKCYQYVHRTNFVEDNRRLRVEVGGRTVDLCKLKRGGKSDQEVALVMAILKAKNPSVHLGYR